MLIWVDFNVNNPIIYYAYRAEMVLIFFAKIVILSFLKNFEDFIGD